MSRASVVREGEDFFRCGADDDLRFTGVVRYHDILDGQRIVYSEVMERALNNLVAWVDQEQRT